MADIIRPDFDRLALLDDDGWSHNSHYQPFLLKHIPTSCDESLDIGCGAGAFCFVAFWRSVPGMYWAWIYPLK